MRIGAHVSTAGGIDTALDRAVEIGAECVQIFCSPPQSWGVRPVPPERAEAFRRRSIETGVAPAFLHGIYLMNFGTPDPANLKRSVSALTSYMECAAAIGALGVIFHAGSHKGAGFEGVLGQVVDALGRALAASPGGPWLVIENAAGMGNHIGAAFQEIGRIMQGLSSPRVKLCLDTQHSFAAGYQVSTRDGLERTLEELDREVGLPNLVAVHANDSRPAFGSGVDRHENIGEGQIGLAGFEVVMAHPAFADVPFLLEVPGMAGKGPDRENVERLKAVRQRASAAQAGGAGA